MKIRQVMLIGALMAALPNASVSAQTRATPASGMRMASKVSYQTGGCATCGVAPSAGPSCGCAAPACGVACDPCCRPRVLPAIINGVDRFVDHVGDTLACVFTRPCCRPCCPTATPCCVKPCAPRVYRPAYRVCDDGCGVNCSGRGCTSGCTSGCSAPATLNPFHDEPEGVPVMPKDARNYQLWNMKPPMTSQSTRPQSQPTLAQPAGTQPTLAKLRPVSQAPAVRSSVVPAAASQSFRSEAVRSPRPLQVEPADQSQLSRGLEEEDVKVKTVRRTSSAAEFSSRIPKNPLR